MDNIYDKVSQKNHFVKAKDLQIEFEKSIEASKCTDKMLLMFEKMIKRWAAVKMYNSSKLDVSASINYAIMEAYLKYHKYNTEKSQNIFSFYNTMLINDFLIHYKEITKGKQRNISFDVLFSNEKK